LLLCPNACCVNRSGNPHFNAHDADNVFSSAFAVDSFGGVAQLLSLAYFTLRYLFMKIRSILVGITLVGLLACNLLVGCANGSGGNKARIAYMPGPVISEGVEYYPLKPGAAYENTPVDYTATPPPPGVVTYVTVISTNGIVIHLIDAKSSTNTVTIPHLL
jgi:hypothetical protein